MRVLRSDQAAWYCLENVPAMSRLLTFPALDPPPQKGGEAVSRGCEAELVRLWIVLASFVAGIYFGKALVWLMDRKVKR